MGNHTSSQLNFNFIFNKDEANRLLESAEQKDFYLAECHDNKVNSLARKTFTYTANYVSFDDAQHYQQWLQDTITRLPMRLRSDLNTISIIPLMYSADGGMPHTRPYNIICIPHLKHLESISTLIHELWHVHQRNFQPLWENIFRALGWTEWKGSLPVLLEEHRRYNPDTIDSPLWIYKNKWVPVPIFKDIMNPIIGEVEIWFYDIEQKYHTKTIPPSLSQEFPNLPSSAYEHPRELSAYLLADTNIYSNTKAYSIIRAILPDSEINRH
jgi:hypothetical protein